MEFLLWQLRLHAKEIIAHWNRWGPVHELKFQNGKQTTWRYTRRVCHNEFGWTNAEKHFDGSYNDTRFTFQT